MTPIETEPLPEPCGEDREQPVTAEAMVECTTCSKEFLTEVFPFGSTILAMTRECADCRTKAAAEAQKRIKASREAAYQKMAGPYYSSEAIRAAMPLALAQKCRALVMAGKGILAFGMSGRFKTTCIFNGAVRWLIMNRHHVTYMTAAQFNDRVMEAARNNRLTALKRELKNAEWLFIDDIGHRETVCTGEALHDILEARVNDGLRPVLVTSQFSADKMVERFDNTATGLAIARRLRILSEPLNFDEPQPETTP